MTWLLANSAVALALSVVVALVGRLLRPAPAVMHGLWLLVLLKLVTPPLFELPIAFGGGAPVSEVVVPVELGELRRLPAVPDRVVADAAVVAPADLGTLTFVLWCCGAAAVIAFVGLGAMRQQRRHRRLGPVDGALRTEVERLAIRLGVRVPELADDALAAAPYVWSFGTTRLLLPAAMLRSCSPNGRAAVLAHELAHLKRGDHWIARLEVVLAVVLWWHPLFWLARGRLRLFAELACDAIAIAAIPGASLDYAAVLVDAVARPDPSVPGLAGLASRPAARVAFERRLTMILNDRLRTRFSPLWWGPFAALTCGLFATPVAAQAERESEPVRIEIRINGERVEELSPAERRALLDKLLGSTSRARSEARSEPRSEPRRETRSEPRSEPRSKADPEPRPEPRRRRSIHIEGLDELRELGDLRGLVESGLAEARREIARDGDLKELGITDEVLGLLDDVADGKGIESGLDDVVRAAMKGAGRMVARELADDHDLRELGIAQDLGDLVTSFLANERNQEMVGELANKALHNALKLAKKELRQDADLQRLGITGDVEALIDGVVTGGGDFEGALGRLVEKAAKAAMSEAEGAIETEVEERSVERRRSRRTPRVVR
ncbi:MAG: M56 family metallopeptidase [Planctomycetes bacterium]|nr:M56 family metallopeptidase [Planctomycetota bacterium]